MDNLNCDIEEPYDVGLCDVCENIISKNEYHATMTNDSNGDFIVACIHCIDKIRTELIKNNPTVKLPDSTGIKLPY